MRLNELFEVKAKHVTFVFGRMNPPTLGHKQLLDTAKSVGGDYKIFLSQTQDSKKNPLDYQTKINFVKEMFPEHADNVVNNDGLNTIVKVADWLYSAGYRNATFVAGGDRLDAMKQLLTTYNGVEGKAHGFYKFEVLDFKSSGDREDGAEGVAGVSASNARAAAANSDFEAFKESTGAGKIAQSLYDAVRQGMGINESIEESEILELVIQPGQTRDEKYKGWNLRYQIKPAQGSKEYKGRAEYIQSKQTKPIGILTAGSKEEIVQKLKDAIDSIKGSNQIPQSGRVTIFFNAQLARDVIGHGDEIFADIINVGGKPVLLLSSEDQGGMYRASDRSSLNQRDREGHFGRQAFVMPAKEAIKNGLTLARYGLGTAKQEYMPGVTAIPLEFKNEVYPGERLRMNEPILTVSPSEQGQAIESLEEDISVESSIRSIVATADSIGKVYRDLKDMAETWVDNYGGIRVEINKKVKDFRFIAGGVGARWYNTYFWNKMESSLHSLFKKDQRAGDLKKFFNLEKNENGHLSFSAISKSLPEILIQVGKQMNKKDLENFGRYWVNLRKDYENFLHQIDAEANSQHRPPPAEKNNTIGQQNAEVEKIINDVLQRLNNKSLAGEIRFAIRRDGNKLQALQRELSTRGINL
jgi:hypothetical protein